MPGGMPFFIPVKKKRSWATRPLIFAVAAGTFVNAVLYYLVSR